MLGLATFGWVTVSVIVFLLIVFTSLFMLFVRARGRNPLNTPEKTQALATVLLLFFSTAAAAGGAIATIKVASLSVEISKRQDDLDRTRFVEAKVTRSVDYYSNLLISLSDAYASAVVVDVRMSELDKIPELDKKRILQLMALDVPAELSVEMVALSDRLSALNNSISLIMRDDFAHYCWRKSAEQTKQTISKLEHLNKALRELGVEESKLTLSVENLSDITAIVDVAARRVRASKYGRLIRARLFANSSDIEPSVISDNNGNVRSFMFTGILIFSMSEVEGQGRPPYIASFGAAIIHDLLHSVPNGERIVKCFRERYPKVSGELLDQEVIFDPHNISSANLLSAIEDVEATGYLKLLTKGT